MVPSVNYMLYVVNRDTPGQEGKLYAVNKDLSVARRYVILLLEI